VGVDRGRRDERGLEGDVSAECLVGSIGRGGEGYRKRYASLKQMSRTLQH
jgi:hypothetical protein